MYCRVYHHHYQSHQLLFLKQVLFHKKCNLRSIPTISQAWEQHTCFFLSIEYSVLLPTCTPGRMRAFYACFAQLNPALHSSRLRRSLHCTGFMTESFLRNSPEKEPGDLILNVGPF